jgi:hypothetical protein
MYRFFLVVFLLFGASVAVSDQHASFENFSHDPYLEVAVIDFDKPQKLADFLNENRGIKIIQIESFVNRYKVVSRLWYRILEEYPPEYPPEYP